MLLNGSQIFVEVLAEQGVDTIFGYPGGSVLNLYDELYKNSDRIRHILSAHEQGAAHAADGYARATGKTGVVLATSGPGATNLVTGIATAYMDSVPMVAFTGNVGTAALGKDSFQEVYTEGITMPITKYNFTVRKVEDLADTMRRAFRIAQSGRKGPVVVDIPKDVTANVCEFEHKAAEPVRTVTTLDQARIEEAAEMINSAKRPVIQIGGGVRSSRGNNFLVELAKKAQIPCVYTLMGTGVLRYDDELNLGMLGMHGKYSSNRAVSECDLLFCVGTRFSDRVALKPDTFAKNAKIIQVDIDASEFGKNVGIDLAITGDAAYVLRALLPLVEEAEHGEWLEQIAVWQGKDFVPERSEDEIKPQQLVEEICDMCGPDAYYVTDVGQHQMWAAQYIKHVDCRHFITSGGLGTMGFGYGASIGVQVALGNDTRVVMLTGDGSFHMNMVECVTAVSYKLPIITVIFDNQVLGMVRQWQTAFYGKRYSQTDPHRQTDYVKVAEGFGAKCYDCKTMPEFREAFKKALDSDGPVWIHCAIGKDEKVIPMIPGGKDINDIIMD
ncbi:MAG: biosynthetic-type acetolactate synthase large subunit [Coriobacteriales bacterium]|jgi:acetolactate synthase-1/2/3 large subunit